MNMNNFVRAGALGLMTTAGAAVADDSNLDLSLATTFGSEAATFVLNAGEKSNGTVHFDFGQDKKFGAAIANTSHGIAGALTFQHSNGAGTIGATEDGGAYMAGALEVGSFDFGSAFNDERASVSAGVSAGCLRAGISISNNYSLDDEQISYGVQLQGNLDPRLRLNCDVDGALANVLPATVVQGLGINTGVRSTSPVVVPPVVVPPVVVPPVVVPCDEDTDPLCGL